MPRNSSSPVKHRKAGLVANNMSQREPPSSHNPNHWQLLTLSKPTASGSPLSPRSPLLEHLTTCTHRVMTRKPEQRFSSRLITHNTLEKVGRFPRPIKKPIRTMSTC